LKTCSVDLVTFTVYEIEIPGIYNHDQKYKSENSMMYSSISMLVESIHNPFTESHCWSYLRRYSSAAQRHSAEGDPLLFLPVMRYEDFVARQR
jgi:hypothetical protein